MDKKALDRIIEGLNEALAVAKEEAERAAVRGDLLPPVRIATDGNGAQTSATLAIKSVNVSRRLMILRYALGCGGHGGKKKFAEKYGFTNKEWSDFERERPFQLEHAAALIDRIPELTLDWIFLGDISTMSLRMRAEIEEGERALAADGPEVE